MMMETTKNFITGNVPLTAYLCYRGLTYRKRNLDGKILFEFERTGELYKFLTEFQVGEFGAYVDVLRDVRADMFKLKQATKGTRQ
jgi:hypothetical protein